MLAVWEDSSSLSVTQTKRRTKCRDENGSNKSRILTATIKNQTRKVEKGLMGSQAQEVSESRKKN